MTPTQKLARREYDRRRRATYAARRKELEQTPDRQRVRTAYLRKRRTKPEIALSLLIANAKYRAKKNGIPFDLSLDAVAMPETCPVLGIGIVHGNEDLSLTARDCAPSLDRLNRDLGYVVGNVRVISWRANRLKNDATVPELEAVLAYMKGEIP